MGKSETTTCDLNHPDIEDTRKLAIEAGATLHYVHCTHCHAPHIDLGKKYGANNHRRHLCANCNRFFFTQPCVSLPPRP